jgi:hypothetical protein
MSVPSIKSSTDECNELKNITYKTMMSKSFGEKKNTSLHNNNNKNISNIEVFLDKERKINKGEPWNKIDKTEKIKQLSDYVDSIVETYSLTETETNDLKEYLSASLDKKKLLCVKDVQYDKLCGKIKTIPCLHYNATSRKFTLKRNEKRVSTLKSLGKGSSMKAGKEPKTLEPKGLPEIVEPKGLPKVLPKVETDKSIKDKADEKPKKARKKPIAIASETVPNTNAIASETGPSETGPSETGSSANAIASETGPSANAIEPNATGPSAIALDKKVD